MSAKVIPMGVGNLGTQALLELVRQHFEALDDERRQLRLLVDRLEEEGHQARLEAMDAIEDRDSTRLELHRLRLLLRAKESELAPMSPGPDAPGLER